VKYLLFYPVKDESGSNMLNYIMGEKPTQRDYVKVFESEIVSDIDGPDARRRDHELMALDNIWEHFQRRDENPMELFKNRSMCIGDIVQFPSLGKTFVCETVGWRELQPTEVATIRFDQRKTA
jgi:hypothetical protein